MTPLFALSAAVLAHMAAPPALTEEARLDAVRGIVDAVNARDADAYVEGFAPGVVIRLYQGEVRVEGREAMRLNRAAHFERFPRVRNELRHLVAIDDRVIMHDRVFLDGSSGEGRDIVEIFTFEDGYVTLIDVIQPANLFDGAKD
jgi:hypothetical protein